MVRGDALLRFIEDVSGATRLPPLPPLPLPPPPAVVCECSRCGCDTITEEECPNRGDMLPAEVPVTVCVEFESGEGDAAAVADGVDVAVLITPMAEPLEGFASAWNRAAAGDVPADCDDVAIMLPPPVDDVAPLSFGRDMEMRPSRLETPLAGARSLQKHTNELENSFKAQCNKTGTHKILSIIIQALDLVHT